MSARVPSPAVRQASSSYPRLYPQAAVRHEPIMAGAPLPPNLSRTITLDLILTLAYIESNLSQTLTLTGAHHDVYLCALEVPRTLCNTDTDPAAHQDEE